MNEWQRGLFWAAVGFFVVYALREIEANAGSGLRWNGYAVSEQQKAMLDAQDAAFSASMDYTSGPFVPFVPDYRIGR